MEKELEKQKMFAAIDIGTTKIVALVGYKNESGSIVVIGKGETPSEGMNAGTVVAAHQTTTAIKRAVAIAEKEAGFFPKKVVVGVAGRHIVSERTTVQRNRTDASAPITQKELDELFVAAQKQVMILPEEEIIHVIPQDYQIDGCYVKSPLDLPGGYVEANFHIVKGKTKSLDMIKSSVRGAGLETSEDMFYLEPLASSDAVLTDAERKRGVALIDMGGGTTDIAIYYDGILQTTEVVPFGGELITKDIMCGCEIMKEDAEALKLEWGSALQEGIENVNVIIGNGCTQKTITSVSLAGIIQSRIIEIINSVQYTIYTSGYADKITSLVLTGGGANLKNLSQLLNYLLKKPSEIKTPISSIQYRENTLFNNPKYSTVVGLLQKSSKHWGIDYQQYLAELEAQKAATVVVEEPQLTEESVKSEPTTRKRFWGSIGGYVKGFMKEITNVDDEYKLSDAQSEKQHI